MIKKAVIISYKNRPIFVSDIKEFKTYEDFASVSKEAENNLTTLVAMFQNDRKELKKRVNDLELRIRNLEIQIKYDHGDISKEEYDELCGSMN